MKRMTLGMGLLVGGLLAVSSARADCGRCAAPAGAKTDEAKTEQAAAGKEIKLQTICPVMGGAIDKNQYVDHDGKRVYICCKGCEAPLKKDPAKFIRKLEADGVTVARLQAECPVKGGAIDKALYVDHAGKRIYVCCQGCLATVKKDAAKYVASMEAAGVVLGAAGKGD